MTAGSISFRILVTALATFAWNALWANAARDDFTALTLEELSQIQVTSIGRTSSSLFDTAAAAYVLTGEDIHRLGATDLGSALRPVPGLQVSRIDPSNYAISSRGFNDYTSSKLLVLMDGRSLYSQTYSGAYWSYHELMLEDLDRVEIVRGPGATLWGANAVNGVINIVSRSAFSTLGTLVTAARGDELDGLFAVRHGFRLNASTAMRVYARHHEEGNFGATFGTGYRGWDNQLIGARLDWKRPGGGGLMLTAEYRDQTVSSLTALPLFTPPYTTSVPENRDRHGGNIVGRWRQPVPMDGELSIQLSYERLDAHGSTFGESHHILDSDIQLTLHPAAGHEVLAGISARRDEDKLTSTAIISYGQERATTSFAGAFIQDEITLPGDRWSVTPGAKIERNSFTGWELQPSLRTLWQPSDAQTVWAAVARAARTPSRAERSIRWLTGFFPPGQFGSPLPTLLTANGSSDFDSEYLTAFEVGHRIKATSTLSFDTAAYYNRYRDVRGLKNEFIPFVPTPAPHSELKVNATNNVHGGVYGAEFTAIWRATSALRLEGSVSTIYYDLSETRPLGTPEMSIAGIVGSTPRDEFRLRANWDFHDDWTLDVFAHHRGSLPVQNVPGYSGLDLHLTWRPRHDLEIELVGQNLLDPQHPEAAATFLGGTTNEIARSVYVRVTHRR